MTKYQNKYNLYLPEKTMWRLWVLGAALICVTWPPARAEISHEAYGVIGELQDQILRIKNVIDEMLYEFKVTEFKIDQQRRTTAGSGVKQIRSSGVSGTKSYQEAGITDATSIMSMHDHSEFKCTAGLGEFPVVLNGLEFTTRHNDYPCMTKSSTVKGYDAVEEVSHPGVPASVSALVTPEEQIQEMREYFKAFKFQNSSHRDYADYFKATLVYLEGAWMEKNSSEFSDPFASARHQLAADSWRDLFLKNQYYDHTGHKENNENICYLPTKICDVTEEYEVIRCQWVYRIMMHEIKSNFKLNRISVVDDMATRVKLSTPDNPETLSELEGSRQARFKLVRTLDDDDPDSYSREPTYMDKLMGEIAGFDNYGKIVDDHFGVISEQVRTDDVVKEQNAAFYHRLYGTPKATANGNRRVSKGYNDPSLYMAMTKEEGVAAEKYEECNNKRTICEMHEQKWSYALPIEIIILTPLGSWNPYGVVYQGEDGTPEGDLVYDCGNNVTCDGTTPETAFNGINSDNYYMTPFEFFTPSSEVDPADTTPEFVYVRDGSGVVRQMRASGIYIRYDMGGDIGKFRCRYPIPPIYEEETYTWKQIEALKDIVLQPDTYGHMVNNTAK